MVTVTTSLADETATLVAFPVSVSFAPVPAVTPLGEQPYVQVVAVNQDGTNAASLAYTTPVQMRWPKKNAPVEVDIQIPLDSNDFNELDPTTSGNREVQVWWNGFMLGWFKPVTRRADSQTRMWTVTCKDPLWYLTRKYLGKANRTNYLTNGDFESGTGSWTANNAGGGTLTFTAATDDPIDGTHEGKLVGTGAGGWISQQFSIHGGGVGVALFLTAWRRIKTFVSPAPLNLGSTIQRVGATGPGSIDSAAVTTTTPRNIYARDHLVVNVPPNTTDLIEVDLWTGEGERHYDAVTVTVEESIEFAAQADGTGGIDQASILAQMVLYAQGKGPWGGLAPDKPDLNIDVHMPLTGVLKNRDYQLAAHQKVYDGGDGFGICDEFLKAADGVDWRCVSTAAAGKVITTYFPAFAPDTGIELTWIYDPDTHELSHQRGIDRWTYGDSLEQTANAVILLSGWGDTADAFASREEGGFIDPSTLGGITLELVDTVADGTPIGSLNALAAGKGAQVKDPITTPTFVLKEPRDPDTDEITQAYIGVVLPGAIVGLNVRDGTLAFSGPASVASVTLDFATEELSITVDA